MSKQTNILPDNPQIEVVKSGCTGLFTNYIYKAIPLAFDESMSYYETLCGLLHYLKNVIIPTVNNNADAVAELQTLYEELRTYVDDYFKGLDVQEEINNKLDEMVEDGTLQEIIGSYLNSKAVFGFDTIESMQESTNLINGSYAKIIGYYSKNDGTNKNYYISNEIIGNDYIELNNGLYAIPVKDKSTRKLNQPIYGYLWLQNIPVNDQKINVRNYKLNGFDGFIMCLHLEYSNNDFQLLENLNDIKQLCNYCEEQNMEVNSFKFHFTPESSITATILEKYYTKINEIMQELKDYSTNIYILNEATYITGFETEVMQLIGQLKSNYNVGISFNIGSLRITSKSILNILDFVGYNYYPNLSSQGKYSNKNIMQNRCNDNEDMNMIIYLISLFGKNKVNITETGIRDYYIYLREPSNYTQEQIEENNGDVVKLYYSIVLETLNNNVNSISTWFKTLYDSTFDFWTEWTGGIK